MQQPADTATHHVFLTWIVGPNETRTNERIERVHRSRKCTNCHAYGPNDADWVREGGIEEFGNCMNLCGAAEVPDPAARYCSMHQTSAEFHRNLMRPESPALDLATT